MTTVILGAGITGLLAKFYIKDSILIGNEIGGENSRVNFPLGPRFLKKTKETLDLLEDLNLPVKEKTVKIGYYYNNRVHDTIPKGLIAKYYEKTRGITLDFDDVPESTMSNGDNVFSALDVNFDLLISTIKSRIFENSSNNIIVDNIKKINLEKQNLKGERNIYEYDVLINTIPLPDFVKISKIKTSINFEYLPITYLYVKCMNDNLDLKFDGYSYIYFPEEYTKFYRITKTCNSKFVFEFPLIIKPNQLRKHINLKYFMFLNVYYSKYGHFKELKKDSISLPNNVKMLGRYAEWRHLRVHDTLKRIREINANN
jgi:hypothetical protein